MDKMDHLMAEKNKNNKDSQKGQVTTTKKNTCSTFWMEIGITSNHFSNESIFLRKHL
jgi:hypothetical protein